MRTQLALSILAAALIAGCGGAGPGATTNGQGPGATQAATSGPDGAVDCTAILSAAEKLIGIQLLAQIATPENVESMKSIKALDFDTLLTNLDTLHALDGVSTPLGSAKDAIDDYEAAAKAAKALFEMDPVTQEAIDAYNDEHVVTLSQFLGKQIAISAAIDEAGCKF